MAETFIFKKDAWTTKKRPIQGFLSLSGCYMKESSKKAGNNIIGTVA